MKKSPRQFKAPQYRYSESALASNLSKKLQRDGLTRQPFLSNMNEVTPEIIPAFIRLDSVWRNYANVP